MCGSSDCACCDVCTQSADFVRIIKIDLSIWCDEKARTCFRFYLSWPNEMSFQFSLQSNLKRNEYKMKNESLIKFADISHSVCCTFPFALDWLSKIDEETMFHLTLLNNVNPVKWKVVFPISHRKWYDSLKMKKHCVSTFEKIACRWQREINI